MKAIILRISKNVIAMTLVFVLLFTMTTKASAYIPFGVIGSGLYGNYVVRAKTHWCWAACAENINRWNNTPVLRQRDAVHAIKGTATDPYPDVSGTEYETCLAAAFISNYSKSFINTDLLQYDDVCDQLYSNHHTIIACLWPLLSGGTEGHEVLIEAWYNPDGSERVTYFDPGNGRNISTRYEDLCCNFDTGFVCLSQIVEV